MSFGCKKSTIPVISDLTCFPESRSAGTVFTLKVVASDQDEEVLTYQWKSLSGSFLTSIDKSEIKWHSPVDGVGKTHTLSVIVSDGKDEAMKDFQILLGEPKYGEVAGYVYFTNIKLPITGALVSVDSVTSITDERGYFSMGKVVYGDYNLMVTKQDFNTVSTEIKVNSPDTLKVNVEIFSVINSTKLSGIVSDQEGVPLQNVNITVLNSDGTQSNLKTSTNSSGFYRLWYVPFGVRTIIAEKSATDDSKFVSLRENYTFADVESQLDLVVRKIPLRGQFKDMRDNHLYNFTVIGNQTWMSENLAFLPRVNPTGIVSTTEAYYYVYGYQGTDTAKAIVTEGYNLYGVYYNRQSLKTACPPGWHVPNQTDWYELTDFLGAPIGRKMKSKTGWSNHGNGDNTSGFSAMPTGRVNDNGTFMDIGKLAYFWKSDNLLFFGLTYDSDLVYGFSGNEKMASPIRCLKDN